MEIIRQQAPKKDLSPEGTCPTCKGSGWTTEAEGFASCVCQLAQIKRAFLGEELFEAEKLPSSPLVEATNENLWVTYPWSELLPHLRLALGSVWARQMRERGSCGYRFSIVTDHQVVQATVSSRAEQSVEELVSGDIDLVILRLGFLPTANVAAASALLGAVRNRVEILRRPIWITNSKPYIKGHLSWSQEAETYFSSDLFGRIVK